MPDGTIAIALLPTPTTHASALERRLMLWLSPAFPVGAFAFSHGLEHAAEAGWVRDRSSLEGWLRDLIEHGALRNDLVLLAAAWRAVGSGHAAELADINRLALALQPSAERHLETTTQGTAFAATIRSAWPYPSMTAVDSAFDSDIAYPVAVGAAVAGHGIGLDSALSAFATAFASNLTSAAIRLSLIGQTDGQRIVAALLPALDAVATAAATLTLDDVGGATLRSDVASLAHETQYSRLFRS